MNGLGSPIASLAAVVAMLGLGCASPAGSAPVARLLIGDADTFTVYSRLPVHLPARAVDGAGREIVVPPAHFTWLSGDSIPVSSEGALMCHRRGHAVVGAVADAAFARVVVRCLPVRSARMAGPVDLLLRGSPQPLQVEVIGLDGKPMGAVWVKAEILRPAVVRLDAGHLIPGAPGGTSLSLTVGDTTATISVHVYEEVPTLEALRPEQDHVAVPLRLGRGESNHWTLPAGTWVIAMQPNGDLPDGLRVEVEGATCESMGWPRGRLFCGAKASWIMRVSVHPASTKAELRTTLLLRRTRG